MFWVWVQVFPLCWVLQFRRFNWTLWCISRPVLCFWFCLCFQTGIKCTCNRFHRPVWPGCFTDCELWPILELQLRVWSYRNLSIDSVAGLSVCKSSLPANNGENIQGRESSSVRSISNFHPRPCWRQNRIAPSSNEAGEDRNTTVTYWSACRRPAEVRRIGLIFDRASSNLSKMSNFRGVPQVMMETTIKTERVTDYET